MIFINCTIVVQQIYSELIDGFESQSITEHEYRSMVEALFTRKGRTFVTTETRISRTASPCHRFQRNETQISYVRKTCVADPLLIRRALLVKWGEYRSKQSQSRLTDFIDDIREDIRIPLLKG